MSVSISIVDTERILKKNKLLVLMSEKKLMKRHFEILNLGITITQLLTSCTLMDLEYIMIRQI